jgi:enoyl-[acyl-carrier protein] reductase III
MTDAFGLHGRRILVTGGTRGIGRAIALELARAGAAVVANYVRNDEAAVALQVDATAQGLALELLRADLTLAKGLTAVVEHMKQPGAEIVSLVHCAATGVHAPIEDLSARHFDWTLGLNVRAFFELTKALLPVFCKGSAIVAVSSAGAVRAVPAYSMVGSSKGALESLARHLAAELAPRGVRVNVLSPGSVETGAWDAFPDKDKRLGQTVARTPIGRLVEPEEVARAARFLCCDAASGIVGHTLVVDGGVRIVE